jgi:serine phosphatase RsbU (regulator of sigma subunit)
MPSDESHVMPCMEVWGGNQAVDGGVVMAGLDAWVYSAPFQAAGGGGDVYYVSSCATGRVTRILVADVSGHGAEASETGVGLRRLMRRYVNHIDQRRFIVALNEQFQTLAATGRFATAVVATFFSPTNRLSISNAGHPPPLVRSGKTGEWAYIKSQGGGSDAIADVPLGVLDESDYSELTVRLRVGDLVLFYTDGLVEGRTADGKRLGQEGLLEVVRNLDKADGASLLEDLREALETIAPESLTADDLTLLLVRPNGLAPKVPWGRRLLAPGRVAAGVITAIARRTPVPWPQATFVNIFGAFFQSLNKRM